jgi:hypothetical protein
MGEYPLKTHMEFQVKNLRQYLREETLGTCFPHYIYILIFVLKKKGKFGQVQCFFIHLVVGFGPTRIVFTQ